MTTKQTDEMPDVIYAWLVEHDQGCFDLDGDNPRRTKYINAEALIEKLKGMKGAFRDLKTTYKNQAIDTIIKELNDG